MQASADSTGQTADAYGEIRLDRSRKLSYAPSTTATFYDAPMACFLVKRDAAAGVYEITIHLP